MAEALGEKQGDSFESVRLENPTFAVIY